MQTTIFVRILLATLLPLIFVFVMVITTISNIIYANEAKSARRSALLEARQIARQLSDKLADGMPDVLRQSIAELVPASPAMTAGDWQILLFTGQGKVVYASVAGLEDGSFFEMPFSNAAALRQAVEKREPFVGEGRLPTAESDSLICLYPITHYGSGTPIFLYLGMPVENVYSMARSSMELIISTSMLGLLLLSFCVFLATRNIVRPIKRLTVDFNRVSTGDVWEMSPPAEGEQHSNVVELNILETALWRMLSQINQNHELRLKATEEQVEREKVVAASQAKSQFFASMSHEIRTPMNAILGISEILLHHNLAAPERKYVQDINTSSEALLTIINDLLDIARLESGKLELADRDFDFSLFLENIRTMGEYLCASNHLEFRYYAAEELPACLRGDDVRLRQILLNLLSNACKFTSEGSVAFQVHATEGRLVFAVRDTGPGISEEQQAGLFEPFKRIDNTRNQKIQGTGLGLAIAKSLVEMMDGSLKVKSTPGKGSTFTMELPLVSGDACALEQSQDVKRTIYRPGVKILIVDDNEINLAVAAGLLKNLYNFDSDLALSGRDALAMVSENDYALVLMDHMMPDMDGLETTRRIRDMGGKCLKMPILALTANAIKGAKEAMLEAGLDDYLTKPIEVNALERLLRKWLPDELKVEQP